MSNHVRETKPCDIPDLSYYHLDMLLISHQWIFSHCEAPIEDNILPSSELVAEGFEYWRDVTLYTRIILYWHIPCCTFSSFPSRRGWSWSTFLLSLFLSLSLPSCCIPISALFTGLEKLLPWYFWREPCFTFGFRADSSCSLHRVSKNQSVW